MNKLIKLQKKNCLESLEVSSKVTKTLHGTYPSKMKTYVQTNTYKKISRVIYSLLQKTGQNVGK